jgi:hypothetical protein
MLLTVLLASGAALGITGGWADDGIYQDGEPEGWEIEKYPKYPNVGALVDPDGSYCTGTLISETVFLTAAHCAPRRTGDGVTFDAKYVAESSKVYKICKGQNCTEELAGDQFDGKFKADPNGYDIAVVVFFDPPFADPNNPGQYLVTPAQLPSRLHQFDRVEKGQKFTAVGYGEQGETSTVYDTRNYAVSTFKSVSEDYLRLSQNLNQDDGGTCYGDSGGPNFFGAAVSGDETKVIASITNTGDPWCKATNVTLRLDNEAARTFLSRPFLDGEGVTPPS